MGWWAAPGGGRSVLDAVHWESAFHPHGQPQCLHPFLLRGLEGGTDRWEGVGVAQLAKVAWCQNWRQFLCEA